MMTVICMTDKLIVSVMRVGIECVHEGMKTMHDHDPECFNPGPTSVTQLNMHLTNGFHA